jgi:hypothetical protein
VVRSENAYRHHGEMANPPPEGIAKAEGNYRKEIYVTEIVMSARDECSEILPEIRVLIYRFTPTRLGLVRIACVAVEGNLQSRLANIVERCFYRKAETAAGARDNIPETQGKAGRGLSKIDRSRSMQRVSRAADVSLPV